MIFYKYVILFFVYLLLIGVDVLISVDLLDFVEGYLEIGDPKTYGKLKKLQAYSDVQADTIETSLETDQQKPKISVDSKKTVPVSKSYVRGSGMLWLTSILIAKAFLGF